MEKTQLEGMVEGLTAVRDEFFKNKKELKYSVRKDVVAVQLRSFIAETNTYDELKTKLEKYITELLEM